MKPFLVTVFLLLWAIAPSQLAFGAGPENPPRASAAAIMGANAQLNGARLTTGATIFPGDVVTLGADSSAALQFGNGIILAAPDTELAVESGSVSLRSGRVQVRLSSDDSFALSGPFFRVNIARTIARTGSAVGTAEIRVDGTRAQISVVAGVADLTAAGSDVPYRLHTGEVATLGTDGDAAGGGAAGGQSVSGPAAGQISRMTPEVQIGRASLTLQAAVSTPLYWNDELHSGPLGRARATLNDGSLLNLGSNSSLRVIQHDAQAQVTTLDLAVGRIRGHVMKLSRPGAKFEIRTPVGIVGLVGTDFYLEVESDHTELIVFEGVVRFSSIAGGSVATVTSGMKLLISFGGTFDGPTSATPQEIQEAIDSTDVPDTVARQGGSPTRRLAAVWISVGTGAAAIGIGVALGAREPESCETMTARNYSARIPLVAS